MKDTGLNRVQDLYGEKWVLINGFLEGIDGKYAASNFGRVKRIIRHVATYRKGNWVISEKIMPQRNDNRGTNGYMRVSLSIGHTSRLYLVHRIVAHCFHPNPDWKLLQVNHKDFNTHNNNESNLEWVTREQNIAHYQIDILSKINNGGIVSNYRFIKSQIIEIYLSKDKMKDISSKYNVNWRTIKEIKLKRTFKDITANLPDNLPRREKLTKEKILDIYNNRHLPVKTMEIKYGIKQGCIIAVRTGRRYSDITGHIRSPH